MNKLKVLMLFVVMILAFPVVSASTEEVKGQHGWFGVEYNTKYNATQDSINVITIVNRTELGFKLSSKCIIVQKKTNNFGWYYPIGDTSSANEYYYVDDVGNYRVVTHFKTNASDVKILVYPDTTLGHIEKFISSSICGIKKLLIDLVNFKVK